MAEKRETSPFSEAASSSATSLSVPFKPSITLPPRSSVDNFFCGGLGVSPGPMTLVSSFFSDNDPESECRSFSQLLAGAIASSPLSPLPLASSPNFEEQHAHRNFQIQPGRSPSPLFSIPPGLSPTTLLDSPRFITAATQGPYGISHHQQALSMANYTTGPSSSSPLMNRQSKNSDEESPSTPAPASHQKQNQNHQNQMDKPADDCYNWRKYGQKLVKGSAFPRSYYKCTHPDCPVRKKVERSLEGHITEIIYKGHHNHQPPPPSSKQQQQQQRSNGYSECPETSESDLLQDEPTGYLPSTIDASTDSGEEPHEAHEEEEPASKRRSLLPTTLPRSPSHLLRTKENEAAAAAAAAAASHRLVTEPRIIVQTMSEVDLLDDGYRWRKYGQKVVKGNLYPRSYYKCTSVGCNVRKHVERAAADPKAVVTTYEGKHNHDVPMARRSSHSSNRMPPTAVAAVVVPVVKVKEEEGLV